MTKKELATVWELEPHTEVKHIIYKTYLRAWLPVLGQSQGRLLILDGYAGPGTYLGGQEGSPVIAIREVMNYLDAAKKHGWNQPEIVCIFIESDDKRRAVLEQQIKKIHIPSKIKVNIVGSGFESHTQKMLDFLESKNHSLAPTFAFIDPFGYNLSFALIRRLMNNERCEVFINFMYEFINRFIERDGQETVMTNLFGSDNWKSLNLAGAPSERRSIIHDLYQEQLKTHAAKYVRSFQMKGKKDVTKYFMFYGTNHKLGLQKMKEAMWKVDPSGSFAFSDATNPDQLVLFGNEPDYAQLKSMILTRYAGKQATIDEIEEYVLVETPFLPSHIKRKILKPMEKSKELKVMNIERKRTGTFPPGTVINFR